MTTPAVLWKPDAAQMASANLTRYMQWLETYSDHPLHFDSYQALWEWSVQHPDQFWASLVQYFDLKWSYSRILQGEMPHTRWFEGATLNYAAEILRRPHRTRCSICLRTTN
jgi:acetoacetyl-CoA synthetase